MRTELISIATDTLPLDGASHTPEDRPIAGAGAAVGAWRRHRRGATDLGRRHAGRRPARRGHGKGPRAGRAGARPRADAGAGLVYVITAESFLDRMTAMPDVLELAPTIRCPTLYIGGDEEDRDTYPAEAFRDRSAGPCDVEIVPNCNHFYVGREAAICDLVSAWLARTLDLR